MSNKRQVEDIVLNISLTYVKHNTATSGSLGGNTMYYIPKRRGSVQTLVSSCPSDTNQAKKPLRADRSEDRDKMTEAGNKCKRRDKQFRRPAPD
jgi:hypothetical protein